MKIGQQVQIKEQFQDEGDSELTFLVHDMSCYPRIRLVVAEQAEMAIQPVYTVTANMIEG